MYFGRFLLAQLHMDSLASKTTCKAVRIALRTLPTTLNSTYEEALTRIQNQTEDDRDLARKVLCWLSYTYRSMTLDEIRHALAVEVADAMLDQENLPDEDILVSVCAGLVTVDHQGNIVRLVHYTAQEFFEHVRKSRYPEGHSMIATSCLTYLSFESLTMPCKDDDEMEGRLQALPFLRYAASFWGNHARESPESKLIDRIRDFLAHESRIACSIQIQFLPAFRYANYSQKFPTNVLGFWLASSFGLVEIVKIMLGEGNELGAGDGTYGWTALHRASRNGHGNVVRLLIDAGAPVEVKDKHYAGTALHHAVNYGQIAVVEILLECKAEVNARDRAGTTPLHIAASKGLEDISSLLLESGADSNAQDKAGQTPLHQAASHGHASTASILANYGAIIDAVNKTGWTPLAIAADRGHLNVTAALIKHGSNVHFKDKDGSTPLHHSAWNGNRPVAILLLEHGADIEAQEQEGWSPLHFAVWRGHESMMLELLDRRASITARSADGWTVLHRAILNGHVGTIRLLLGRGADVNAKDLNGESVLQQASWRGSNDVVKILLDSGAVINAKSNNGETALHWAASNGHTDLVKLLVEYGADISIKSQSNETALEQAIEHKETTVAELLLQLEATRLQSDQNEKPKLAEGLQSPVEQSRMGIGIGREEYSQMAFDKIEEVDKEPADPAVLAALSLDPGKTFLAPYGPPGFSKKARVSSTIDGEECTYFMKRIINPDAIDVFEGKSHNIESVSIVLTSFDPGEHHSLSIIHSTVPSVCPRSFGHGRFSNSDGCFMVTEFLERRPERRSSGTSTLAQKLALLHNQVAPIPEGYSQPMFDFPASTICGPTSQPNSYHRSWKDFYIENRLHAIHRACETTQGPDDELRYWIELIISHVVPALLSDSHLGGSEGIQPVVVHGNLWYGNTMRGRIGGKGRVEEVIFDPSACFAHSEFELGIMKLFGGFGAGFFSEYHRLVPKTEPRREYEDRIDLYIL